MSDELPEGWIESPLAALVDVSYGKGLPERVRRHGNVAVYGSNGVVGAHDTAVTGGPAIVVGRKGSVGEVHLSAEPCWPIDTTYFIDSFGPFEPRFLLHLLRNLQLAQHESSTAIPGLSRDDVYARIAKVPPLPEQIRIVAKIEELFEEVNRSTARLSNVRSILRRLRQSVLAAACSGELTREWRSKTASADDEWQSSTVEQVCTKIVDCPHSTPKWADSGEICLRTTNFFATGLDLREVRRVSRDTYAERTSRLVPQPGDIVYSREGGILGIACEIPDGLKACLGQRMMLMRADTQRIRPGFLCLILNSPSTLATVKELTGGTASPHLNVGDIKQFAVPLPTIKEQDAVMVKVNEMFKLADLVEARTARAASLTDKLSQAILSKAFGGELVPTEAEVARLEGRQYESASMLLERVQEHAATTASKAKRSPRGRRQRVSA